MFSDDSVADCYNDFMNNFDESDYDGMNDCEIKVSAAEEIAECCAGDNGEARDLFECFRDNEDCVADAVCDAD